MPTPSSHPCIATWGGAQALYLTSFKVTPGSAVLADVTNVTMAVIGKGTIQARAVLQYECTAIDPGSVDLAFYGTNGFRVGQIGAVAPLTVSYSGGAISFPAILETFDVTGNVGEFLKGTARFRFNGSPTYWSSP